MFLPEKFSIGLTIEKLNAVEDNTKHVYYAKGAAEKRSAPNRVWRLTPTRGTYELEVNVLHLPVKNSRIQ